ncbi:MAG: Crp/Fnr family transcriptional regulator [Ignavibacteriae bacterium]|nr:Crp/Fnr family transcriptional regulator [Ignavibacteriota bacterium]
MAFTTQPFPPITPEVAETIKILRNVPIFGDIDQSELARIVHVGVRKKYKKGSIILLEEEAGAALFIIASGKIKIVRTDDEGREVILSILGENDFFGEMAILDGLARSATAVATTKTDLFMIHRQDFLKLLHEYPAVAISLLRELTSRLRKADAQIKNLSLKDANGRVANVIIQIADDIGKIRKGRVEIDELPLQQDLANMAGTSRETISRMLHQFIKKGHVELQGNKLIINDYEKFKSLYL